MHGLLRALESQVAFIIMTCIYFNGDCQLPSNLDTQPYWASQFPRALQG